MNRGFSGSYGLLKWIIRKYHKELEYNGSIMKFTLHNHYTTSICSSKWKHEGVGYRVWAILEKDLIIATLMGKVKDEDAKTLLQLKEEYLQQIKDLCL